MIKELCIKAEMKIREYFKPKLKVYDVFFYHKDANGKKIGKECFRLSAYNRGLAIDAFFLYYPWPNIVITDLRLVKPLKLVK